MAQYINKAAVVAEIERLKTIYNDDENIHHIAKYNILVDILSFLNALKVKEVDEEPASKDLEDAVKKYLTSLRKSHFEGYDIERAFKKVAQWQKERIKLNL